MKITDYHILIADNQVSLSQAVRDYLKKGWEPLEGHKVAMSQTSDGELIWIEYSQTMIKKEFEG